MYKHIGMLSSCSSNLLECLVCLYSAFRFIIAFQYIFYYDISAFSPNFRVLFTQASLSSYSNGIYAYGWVKDVHMLAKCFLKQRF